MSTFIWILYFFVALIIVFVIDFFFRKSKKKSSRIIGTVAKILLGIGFAVLVMAGPLFLRPFQPIMVALYIVLLGDGITEIIFLFLKNNFLIKKIVSVLLCLSIMIYGTINMNKVYENKTDFVSEKVSKDYSFAFISDMHVGSSQSIKTTKEVIDTLKSLDLDFLVLGGDITDDYTSNEQMKQAFSYFKDFSYPVYYIYGNHDKQVNASYANGKTYTEEELKETLESNNIVILEDSFVTIDEITILGRIDIAYKDSRKDASLLINPDPSNYFIVFDHQPFDTKGIKTLNPDLQVSGHTHAGQFFPLNVFYNLVIGPTYGTYKIDNTNLLVSSGSCGWRVPFRNDHRCEYEVITIKKK